MVPDLPFLFSIAGLSGSVAGLAGLVAGIRRNADLRPIDRFRLREIVEFAFANALLALAILPLTDLLGGIEPVARLVAIAAIAYMAGTALILLRRLRQARIPMTTWIAVAIAINVAALVVAVATIATARVSLLQLLLLLLLARPMAAFLFVLASFDADRPAPPVEPVAAAAE